MVYQCQVCGFVSKKWLGKCPECSNWNSFVEEKESLKGKKVSLSRSAPPIPITEIRNESISRVSTKLIELDRALGGGIVEGQVILIGGSPGIGKSTILTQILDNLASDLNKGLYLTAEESPSQVKIRSDRLNIKNKNFLILSESNINSALSEIRRLSPRFIVVDSIQTVYSDTVGSIPGSISQIRECASMLIEYAKSNQVSLFLVGHITKDGAIAGPKVLEHMVDTVLYFESENRTMYRIVRVLKNRFGSVNEIAIFEMRLDGLKEINDPSDIFLQNRFSDSPGSVTFPMVEGSRVFMVEVQALVSNSTFSMPRRNAQGVDINRINLLITVIEKIIGMNLFSNDIFINIPGGIKVDDPGIDLPIIMSIVSSFLNKKLDSSMVCFGEVGLNGEIRRSSFAKSRVKESERMGFKKLIAPDSFDKGDIFDKIDVIPLKNISDITSFFS